MLQALGSVQVSAMPYLLTILILFTTCVLIFVFTALLDSDRESALVRVLQRARLSRTRMRRMLRRRHVGFDAYARSLPVIQIRRQVRICQNCGLADLCDRALASQGPSRSVFSFCPNRPAIEQFLHLARLRA